MDNLNGENNGNEPIQQIGPGKKRFSDTMMFFIILGIVFLTSLVVFISLKYETSNPKEEKTSQAVENVKEEKKVLNTLSTVRKKAQEDYDRLENLVAQEEQKEKEEQEAKRKAEEKEKQDKQAYLTPSTNTVISEEEQQEIIEDFQESFTGENLKEVNGELVYTDPSGEVHMAFNNEGYMDRMYTIFDCEDEENLGMYQSMFEMFGFTVTNPEGTTLVIEMPLEGYEGMTKQDIIDAFNGN